MDFVALSLGYYPCNKFKASILWFLVLSCKRDESKEIWNTADFLTCCFWHAASMSVFARLLFQSSSWFYRIFQSAKDMDGRSACEAFVELWLERFDSIPSLGARKLSALALCRLLASPMAWIQSHLTAIVTNITSVWFEVS